MSSELFTKQEEWPSRLLYVEENRFQSIQRDGACSYGGLNSPSYNILSYTWGRWETKHGDALPIEGTPWETPIVDRKGFSVEAFAKVVNYAKQGGSFVWLDVGCIDQQDEKAKASEIGKQAAIFRGARQAYIWLSHSRKVVLEPYIMEALSRDAFEIDESWLRRVSKGVQKIF